MYVRSQVTKKTTKTDNNKTEQLIVLYRNQKIKVFAYLLIAKYKLQDQQISTISLSNSDLATNHHMTDKAKIKFKCERTEITEENYPYKLLRLFLIFPLT